jgi:hypothetical protein
MIEVPEIVISMLPETQRDEAKKILEGIPSYSGELPAVAYAMILALQKVEGRTDDGFFKGCKGDFESLAELIQAGHNLVIDTLDLESRRNQLNKFEMQQHILSMDGGIMKDFRRQFTAG